MAEEPNRSKSSTDSNENSGSETKDGSASSSSSHFLETHLGSTHTSNLGYISTHIEEVIAEEDEDEEEQNVKAEPQQQQPQQQQQKEDSENTVQTNSLQDGSTDKTAATVDNETDKAPHDAPKFVLEQVKQTVENSSGVAKENKQTEKAKCKVSIDLNASVLNNNDQSNLDETTHSNNNNNSNNEDTGEIRVEEGYATRQMDEYFRQTIAAIKEELTKKLENQNATENNINSNQNQYPYEIGEFDSNDEFNSSDDYEEMLNDNNESLNQSSYYQHNDLENSHITENGTTTYSVSRLSRRNHRQQLIYQHILASANSNNDKYNNRIGWLVILGLFINLFIIEGVCFNYATLFDSIFKEYQPASKLLVSLPNIFLLSFYLLFAPFSLFLSKRFGCRRIALIGSFISTASLFIASFMSNIITFSIFYGIVNGVGFSLVYVPSLLTLSKWFLKKRLFANTVATFGGCVGATVYPLIANFLSQKYDLNGTILILAGIQFNLLVGSLLLRERKSLFCRLNQNMKKLTSKSKVAAKSDSNKKQMEEQAKHDNTVNATTAVTAPVSVPAATATTTAETIELTNQNQTLNTTVSTKNEETKNLISNKATNNLNPKNIIKRRLLNGDFETQSTTSTSTAPNYTLKQYWRKFVQTRKTPANTKKNLFHLIAEEKRKTRTMSKVSLEDGFVITTSNNLLAPNDESHVIVSSRQAATNMLNTNATNSVVAKPTPKFFTRIANSIRSLATGAGGSGSGGVGTTVTNSPLNTRAQSKTNLPSQQVQQQQVDSSANAENPSPQKAQANKPEQSVAQLQLLSVFNPPNSSEITDLTDSDQAKSHNDKISSNNNNNNNQDTNEAVDSALNEEDSCDNSDSDEDDESKSPNNPNYYSNYQQTEKSKQSNSANSGSNNNAYKFSRYLSYRNSLTNSVRGSLMECSVPEDREEGTDGFSVEDGGEDENRRSSQRPRVRQKGRFSTVKSSNVGGAGQLNSTASNPNEIKLNRASANKRALLALPQLQNIRRIISTIEAASFYNYPLNLETIDYNLKNSLIKKTSENYRHHLKSTRGIHLNEEESTSSLFLDYLNYFVDFRLHLNPLLMFINFSFLLSTIGFCLPMMYMVDFSKEQSLSHLQSIYILCTFGFMSGMGRIICTLAFKSNESNEKSRIFTYNLSLILAALAPFSATFLCKTVFSVVVFSSSYGILFGFVSCLRPIIVYDLLSLEWSDDSLTVYGLLSQSMGIFIGLPFGGLLLDIFESSHPIFYLSSACLLVAFFMLISGRDLRRHFKSSFKAFNRHYIHKRN